MENFFSWFVQVDVTYSFKKQINNLLNLGDCQYLLAVEWLRTAYGNPLGEPDSQGTQGKSSCMHFSGEGTDFTNNWHQSSLKLLK